jgi:hypothetical protein
MERYGETGERSDDDQDISIPDWKLDVYFVNVVGSRV